MKKTGHNLGHNVPASRYKLLSARTTLEDSQSSNPGSIPGSATKHLNMAVYRT